MERKEAFLTFGRQERQNENFFDYYLNKLIEVDERMYRTMSRF